MDWKLNDQTCERDEEHFSALMESATNFVIYRLVYDNSRPHLPRVIFASPSIVDVMGVSDPMKFETWLENIHPDEREEVAQANMRAFETGKFDEVFRIYHPQKKETRWIRAVFTSIGGENDQPLHTLGFIIDVTEQKRVETALMEGNERSKSISKISPHLIFQIDLEGRVTYFYDMADTILGYSPGEMKGRLYQEFISPPMLQSAVEAFENLLGGKTVINLELELLKKDGSYVPCEVSAGPVIVRDNLVGIQAIAKDISKRKEAAAILDQHRDDLEAMVASRTKELRESEERYRSIVDDMPEMVCRFLPDGTVTFANRGCEKCFSEDADGLLGHNFFEWISRNGEKEDSEKEFKSFLEKPYPPYLDNQMTSIDGSAKWIRWTGRSLFERKDSLVEYQVVGLDITEQKNAAIKKGKTDQLRNRAQKLEAIGTLSAGIAHDFNNILAVLMGNVQLAMDDVPKKTRTRKNLNEIYSACLRARDMVQQILTFCRKGEEALRPVSLAPVVKESIKFLKSAIPSTIEIRENIYPTGFVDADPTQISQVLMNLGANAAHAMGDRPGVLNITLKTITIDHDHEDRYRVFDEGEYVKLTVKDTGCGMSPQIISRIFDPYFTTKDEGYGSGMGLAVVHGIVETHGGVIWADSKPGKGAVFHVLLPVAETGITSETEREPFVLKGDERILLVDDVKTLLNVETEILERLGYEVTATTSPIEALNIFREQPDRFDLVYTDMTMPRMTGLTLTKKLKEIRPNLPVILYTGLGNLLDADEIRESGVSAFLKKPVLLEDLASTIREVLENEK